VFAQKQFDRWASDAGLSHKALIEAAKEAFSGQVEADLGGGLFKKRIARFGSGKSGGFRTVLCFRKGNDQRIFFLFGFPKSDKGNITQSEEKALKKWLRHC
jgi:hypothetical protein